MNLPLLFKLKPLVRDFWQFGSKRIMLVIGFMLLSSITSSVGILFIIPLLEAINIDLGSSLIAGNELISNSSSNISNKINLFFAQFGITLDLVTVLVIYVCVIIIKACITFLHSIIAVKLQSNFVLYLRKGLYRKIFYSEWEYLNQEHTPDFIRLMTGQVEMTRYSLQQLLNLCSSLILVSIYLCLAFLVSPTLTILALMLAILLVGLMLPINALIHRSGAAELLANTNIFRNIVEQISKLKIIKSFSIEEKCLAQMDKTNILLEKQHVNLEFYQSLTRFINLVGAATIFSILLYISIQWLKLPTANLLIVLFVFSRLMPQVSGLQNTIMQLLHQAPSYSDLLHKTKELSKHAEPLNIKHKNDATCLLTFKKNITLKNVSFTYPNTNAMVIENINATIPINQSVAITGPSGAGKSTIADIIAGLTKPSSGQLLVDGKEINDQNRQFWRTKVAYVTQDIYLFHDSVRNNLSWLFDKEFSDEQLWHALELSAADTFVKQLPNGIDTLIGDNGVKLSGGERQRLALARAILAKPEILILDEATSALDKDHELKIRDALIKLQGSFTIIVIAHSDATIEHIQQRITLTCAP